MVKIYTYDIWDGTKTFHGTVMDWKPLTFENYGKPFSREKKFIDISKLSPEDLDYYYRHPEFFFTGKDDEDFIRYIRDNRTGNIMRVSLYDVYIYASESKVIGIGKTPERYRRGYRSKFPRRYSPASHKYVKAWGKMASLTDEYREEGYNVEQLTKKNLISGWATWRGRKVGAHWKDQKKIKRSYLKKGDSLFDKRNIDTAEDVWEEYLTE